MVKTIINKIKFVYNLFVNSFQPTKDTFLEYNILEPTLRNEYPAADVWVTDSKTYLMTMNDIEHILKLNLFKNIQFMKDAHDCDNYAFELYTFFRLLFGNVSIGIMAVTGGKMGNHAINFFIDEYMQVWGIEPQTNEIYRLEDKKQVPYKVII